MKSIILLCALCFIILAASKPGTSTVCVCNSMMTDTPKVGVFVGRTPCTEIAKELNITVASDCEKIKWKLTLYLDTKTKAPSTFYLARTGHRQSLIEGNWSIINGTKMNKDAIVYRLEKNESQNALYLWKADDNVLFFLDKEGNCLVGDDQYSYTLNRQN